MSKRQKLDGWRKDFVKKQAPQSNGVLDQLSRMKPARSKDNKESDFVNQQKQKAKENKESK